MSQVCEHGGLRRVCEICELKEELEAARGCLREARECLKEIADEDYRGNRSSASQKAYYFLHPEPPKDEDDW